MSILVCGGAGYIGSHAVHQLVAKGEDVVIVDNLQTGHRDALNPKAKVYEGDIRDAAILDKIFTENNIEAVIHFAANSLVGESVQKPLKYFNNNVYGMQVLLEAMVRNNVDKIVFSSTAAVYGERRQHGEQHAMKILVRKGSLLVRELFRRAELDFRLLFEDRQNRAV